MAVISRTQVINNGLRLIGANLIADPSEDSESGRQAAAVYDQVVRVELEAHAWSFAKAQISLPANADAPLFKYSYSYTLPNDFIRLVELSNKWVFSIIRHIDTYPVPLYEIQGRSILTNEPPPLQLTYIRDLSEDPTLWPPSFAKAVSSALAAELAMILTMSEGMVMMVKRIYQDDVLRARRTNAIQMPPVVRPDDSWMVSRLF